MDELFSAVLDQAESIYKKYSQEKTGQSSYTPYKASGMAYISFAKDEKELFSLIFMRNRSQDTETRGEELELEIGEGELFSLLGVNGAGKTTTIKMLSCLTVPTEGDAFVFGHSIKTESSSVKKLIAVSPQETAVALIAAVLLFLRQMKRN